MVSELTHQTLAHFNITISSAIDPKQFIKQCSNCQGMGHMQGECSYATRCGYYAGRHRTQTCPNPGNVKCALCKWNWGHAAFDRKRCPVLKRAKEDCLRYKKTPEWVTRPLPTSFTAQPTSAASKDVTDEVIADDVVTGEETTGEVLTDVDISSA